MNELEKRAVHHRKRQKGLSPFCSLGESALPDITVYNGTNNAHLDYSTIDLNNSREIGLHCGTEQACRDKGYKFINKLTVKSPTVLQLPFDVTSIWSSIELVRRLAQFELFDEKQLESLENQMRKCADAPDKYRKYSALLREFFLSEGYNVISYVNEIEDPSSTSYILLDMSIVHSDLGEGFNMRLDRKSIDKNRIDIARLLGLPAYSILIHENGRFEIHNISEDDARRYSNILRNKVKDIRLIPGKYDFGKIPMPGQMPNRLVTISGVLTDNLNEGAHEDMKDFPYMFYYSAINPTFGYDFQEFAQSLGARKAYGKYRGTGAGSYFYVVPSEDVYNEIKKVAKKRFGVDVQRLLPYDSSKFPNAQFTDALTEARKKKKKTLGGTLNPDAGNVEHSINMFNHMNSPTGGPSNNPVSGPFGGAVMAESLNMPKYTVDTFNWTHEKVTLTCYDPETDETFEKFICAGAQDEDRGRSNALAILKDPEYDIPTNIRNELVSTYGLDDYGYQLEECTKKRELDDDFDMSMRTLL